MSKTRVLVSTATNIALVKYWGKRPGDSNQPATSSLSIGLEDLRTQTKMEIREGGADLIDFDGPSGGEERIRTYLNWVRQRFGSSRHFIIKTTNNFPSNTGLASSASGFAALAIAINEMLELSLSNIELSRLAMRGSGSAARSVLGGFVEIINDEKAYASSINPAEHWPLAVLVAIVDERPKEISSTDAMLRTSSNSPYYQAWIDTHPEDMVLARDAVIDRDFEKLAEVAERNCLKMHASIMTSRPSIIYWQPATLQIIKSVTAMRKNGIACFFTIDAGSQVKIICEPDQVNIVSETINTLDVVKKLITTRIGGSPIVK